MQIRTASPPPLKPSCPTWNPQPQTYPNSNYRLPETSPLPHPCYPSFRRQPSAGLIKGRDLAPKADNQDLSKPTNREFPKIRGTLFGSPHDKDPTIGSPIFGNSQSERVTLARVRGIIASASSGVSVGFRPQAHPTEPQAMFREEGSLNESEAFGAVEEI